MMNLISGLKPHRKVCMAQWNGVKEFEKAGQSVVTGCTSQPLPKSTFCSLHHGEATPVVENVTRETRNSLKNKYAGSNVEDHHHIVESILDISIVDNKQFFKVKWFGYDEESATWEPSDNIPKFTQSYYSDSSNLGKKLPNPKIKHSNKLTNGLTYHYLSWEGENGGSWMSDDFFSLVGDDEGEFSSEIVGIEVIL